jgi:chromate reductase, NAD(P)H dehydrogenase (quinone)
MDTPITILGICGSLRKLSINHGLLRAAQQLAPQGVTIETFDLKEIPLFNQDDEDNPPAIVTEFKARIRAANAILFATPEYNHSIPGVLKNAIDWASRPHSDNAWAGKPAAIMGAAPGAFGTVRVQNHLRQVFVTLDLRTFNKPEVMIGLASQRCDAEGNLTDEKSKQAIGNLVAALAALTRNLK